MDVRRELNRGGAVMFVTEGDIPAPLHEWPLDDNARARVLEPGDPFFVWKSGDTGGVVARGHLASGAYRRGAGMWVDLAVVEEFRPALAAGDLLAEPSWAGSEVATGTRVRPLALTSEQVAALRGRVPQPPAETVKARRPARSEARRDALEILYEADTRGESPLDSLARRHGSPAYTEQLVRGVAERAHDIDGIIRTHARAWELEHMPVVDRNALRLALWELLWGDVPPAVAMDEAIELCRRFSTEEAGRFVNGILAAVAAERTKRDQD